MILSTLILTASLVAPAATEPAEDADAQARVSATEYIFGKGDELKGEKLQPGETLIRARRPGTHPTMVLIRANFVDRLNHQSNDM